jgi:hypothetical protein
MLPLFAALRLVRDMFLLSLTSQVVRFVGQRWTATEYRHAKGNVHDRTYLDTTCG